VTNELRRRRKDPAVTLAAKLEFYAKRLTAEEHRTLQAMLVMAMDPLDRQARRQRSVLTANEARRVAEVLREK
jgi:hypothetical protein